MKNPTLLFAFFLLVFQNDLAAAPFLVIRPNISVVISPEKQVGKPHFFKKMKKRKLAARLAGPSEWEDGAVHTKGMLMALTGLILFALGFGISVLLEVETISLFLVFAILGIVWAIMALKQAKKEPEATRFITRIMAWATITLGTLVGLLAIAFNGD